MANSQLPRARAAALVAGCLAWLLTANANGQTENLASAFINPPASARPWVYWFWMDGNSSREGITADFEAMARAGIGGVYQMEVDVGIPRGPVAFMSAPWRELFNHAVHEADRLGLQITVNAGPGWTGSGGPWVKPEQSMQKLVFSDMTVTGGRTIAARLPQPQPTAGYYRDVAVLAFPVPAGNFRIGNIDEKALYHRGHFSSETGVRSYVPEPANDSRATSADLIVFRSILDLSSQMDSSGTLSWTAPVGNWTVMRFGHTSTGANTRPAPQAGLGLECDKMDRDALAAHYASYMQPLIDAAGPLAGKSLANLHIDSWEMGSQNWTAKFPQEFKSRRGYNVIPWLPVFSGRVIDSVETSERFLWDVRHTCEELIVEDHAEALKELGRKSGMHLSIEPYDGSPICDLRLGSVADIPMCEFWSNCFQTWYSCFEATSIAHTYGRSIVAAEAFTSDDAERWQFYPGSMKPLGDWAFCRGINRFSFHRYAHQPWLDRAPGMTMGPYGIHYERTQTWWDMVDEYNHYIARCQAVLQQGTAVTDVLYVAPEDSPFVFKPPADAVQDNPPVPRQYHFDCCPADALIRHAHVERNPDLPVQGDPKAMLSFLRKSHSPRIRFDNGSTYQMLVLPNRKAMSIALLHKLKELGDGGATIVGEPPQTCVGLANQAANDAEVQELAQEIWTGAPYQYFRAGMKQIYHATRDENPATAPLMASGELLQNAKWIWTADEANAAHIAAPGTRYFRGEFYIEDGPRAAAVKSAAITANADNRFELYLDGRLVGAGRDFRQPKLFEIHPRKGKHSLAIKAINSGERPTPAGVIAAVQMIFENGTTQSLVTDSSWRAFSEEVEGWTTVSLMPSKWADAKEIGPYGMAPWGTFSEPFHEEELYPSSKQIGQLLEMERGHDFGELGDDPAASRFDYIHRTLPGQDVYFVSNGTSDWITKACTFRVRTSDIEIWNPVDGTRTRPIHAYTSGEYTAVRLTFEPNGSRFVVFGRREEGHVPRISEIRRNGKSIFTYGIPAVGEPACEYGSPLDSPSTILAHESGTYTLFGPGGLKPTTRRLQLPSAQELNSSWTVKFQPNRGAPPSIQINRLTDLSTHSNPAVRHFSGIATYTAQFNLPAELFTSASALQLDLGEVAVMARVRLNGQSLRTLWKAPYAVDITGAARAGENKIEIEVANLWPNRLIGDAGLPEDQRIAKTTWNPFKSTDALPKSGLIGPVVIRPAAKLQLP